VESHGRAEEDAVGGDQGAAPEAEAEGRGGSDAEAEEEAAADAEAEPEAEAKADADADAEADAEASPKPVRTTPATSLSSELPLSSGSASPKLPTSSRRSALSRFLIFLCFFHSFCFASLPRRRRSLRAAADPFLPMLGASPMRAGRA
jgi:hypothetical protein